MYTRPANAVPLPMVSPWGPWAPGQYAIAPTSGPGSLTFEAANRAVYCAILVPCPTVVRRLWWVNGATVSASYNVDCGIYADAGGKPGAKIISTGSTAQGTATQVQFVDVTDTSLAPGQYWIALTCSSASATFFKVGLAHLRDVLYRLEEESALPLPATATPVASTDGDVYHCGFATTSSP